MKNKNHKYLCYTILLLIISIFYFLFNNQKSFKTEKQSKIEYILALSLIVTLIFSQLFWNNPIRNSKIHKMDAIVAKIIMFCFALYTIKYKFKISFLFILLAILIFSYFSNYYSEQEWCSDKHLFYHGMVHIFSFIATFYTFSPVPVLI